MHTTPVAAGLFSLVIAAGLSACGADDQESSSTPTTSSGSSPTSGAGSKTEVGGQFTSGDCEGKDLELSEDETVVDLTGTCGAVSVTGHGIAVNLDNADSITVSGTKNTVVLSGDAGAVTMDGSANFYTGEAVSDMQIPGTDNNVTATTLGRVSLSGATNFVTWTDGAVSAADTGTRNTIAR